jgi:hypothetical protein
MSDLWSQPNQQVVRDGDPVAAGENDGTAPGPEAPPATGATAGTPGSFTPAGCETPADMTGITASPATAWAEGEYVEPASGSTYWDGTAWTSGAAPAPEADEDDPPARSSRKR